MTASISVYKSFPRLRAVTMWAAGIGLLQSLIWIGLTITAIASYNCAISYSSKTEITDKTVIGFTFYEIYFKSEICTNPTYNNIPQSPIFNDGVEQLKQIKTVLNPEQLFIWICVYLGCSVVWFMASALLLINVRADQMRLTTIFLYLWILVTLSISGMDLALGVIFGIDFGRFSSEANIQRYAINSSMTILLSAQMVSISMMIIAFKGFVLWIINISLVCYLFNETLSINKAVTVNKTSYFNRAYQNTNGSTENVSEMATDKTPIHAFETRTDLILANGTYEIEKPVSSELNFEPIERASRISTDNLQERRLRNLSSYQQYPPPTMYDSNSPLPAPDYTPPMPRSSRLYSGHRQSSRYN